MGCCVSIGKKIPPPPSFSKSSRADPPPPPPLDDEEETVKEVLSETPIPKIQHEPKKNPPKLTIHKIQSPVKNNDDKKTISVDPIPTAEEVSEEVSEICSTVSETVSTTTFNEKRENDVSGSDVRQRSPTKYRNNLRSGSDELRRERAVGKSPARGSDQSPARGSDQSPGRLRSVNGRERRVVAAHRWSSIPVPRSGSPGNRTGGGDGSRNGVGRSPSVRKSGKSPSRVGSDLNRGGEGGKWVEPTTTNESLENPLVSLECFIFL